MPGAFSVPAVYRPASILLSTRSFESIGGIGNRAINTTILASTAWPTANKAIFVPITLNGVATIIRGFWLNGGVASGNVDVGVYDVNGNRLCSTGAVAQGTISVVQDAAITSTKLGPGRYYLGISLSSATGTIGCQVPALAGLLGGLGCAEMAAAHPLPATATLASNTMALMPLFGVSQRTLIS